MTNFNEQMKEMALEHMIEAIEKAMEDAKKTEEHCLKEIEYCVKSRGLHSSDIINAADDLKAAQAIQRAISDAYSYMKMYTHEY